MKKVLCITLMALMAAAIAHAEGENEPGRFGLGYQGVFVNDGTDSGSGGSSPAVMNAIALRFAPQPIGGSLTFGQYSSSWEDNDTPADEWTYTAWTLQGKFLWTLIDRPNSDFYVGGLLGFAYYEADDIDPNGEWSSVILGGLAGVEWRFTELPEIGFNFEVGYNVESGTWEEGGTSTYEEDGIFAGTSVTMGATYYF